MNTKVRLWEQTALALLIWGSIEAALTLAQLPFLLRGMVIFQLSGLVSGGFLAFVILVVVWRSQTRQIRAAIGAEGGFGWAIGVYVVLGIAEFGGINGLAKRSFSTIAFTVIGLRVAVIVFAIYLVYAVRRDLRRALAAPPSRPVPEAPVRYDEVSTAAAPPADDAFWSAVGSLAESAGTELPLLETTTALERRWLWIPASGDVTAIRAEVAPGALVTVFPAVATPLPAASEYYGLVQATPTAPARFRLVLPSRVAEFRTTAGHAHRASLHYAADPAARTAAVGPAPSLSPA